MVDHLVFQTSPWVQFGGNFYRDVPVILQVDDTPLVEVVRAVGAGFTTQVSIYHNDGTYLAKVKGSQMYLTESGKKAGLELRHPGHTTLCCEMNGRVLLELQRDGPAALKGWAELNTPAGVLVKGTHTDVSSFGIDISGNQTKIGTLVATGNMVVGFPIGIHIQKHGHIPGTCVCVG